MQAIIGFTDATSEVTHPRDLLQGQFYRVADAGTMHGAMVSRIKDNLYAVWSLQRDTVLFQTFNYLEAAGMTRLVLAKRVTYEVNPEVAV